ncbi:uncharacterized protein [Amphiura filiformis]|uniref:uncharacterized protein n=1 Tax=Amphiura filiformis TaxID=82378 RepID=UPI003B2136A6
MPRVPSEPVPELTVRGTVRKNQLYVPEEDIQRALQMVRDGVYVARASRLCKVPFTRLEARVKELKDSGDLEIYWGKNAPHYLAKLNEQNAPDEVGDGGGKTKRKRRSGPRPYSEENLALAVEAVKSGMYTINAAHNVYNIPGKLLYELMRTDKPIRALMNKKNRNKAKLTYNEEEAVVEYALALDKIGFQVTYMSLVPLAMQYTTDRGNPVKDVHGWAKLFARRHPELDGKYLSPPAVRAITKQQLAKKMFDRLAELYDTHNFHLKPSRIYACEGISLRVERWEADVTKNIDVEMLVAANAVGFHILPPCVVYSNEEGDGIPDFLGLPEAGFVVSDKKKLTAPIVAEWFRSVFLHYLLPRTAEDPVALVLHGHHDWFSPELLQMAEKEHVHLVPVCPQIRFWTNPIQSILLKLRDAYIDRMLEIVKIWVYPC